MNLVVVAGSGNPSLADSIAERLGTRVCRSVLNRFPDTELHAEIEESVRGCDVYVVQPTGNCDKLDRRQTAAGRRIGLEEEGGRRTATSARRYWTTSLSVLSVANY